MGAWYKHVTVSMPARAFLATSCAVWTFALAQAGPVTHSCKSPAPVTA